MQLCALPHKPSCVYSKIFNDPILFTGLAHASVGQPSNVSQQLTPSTSRQSSSISRTRHFDESQLSVSDPIALHDSNVSNREATFPCNNPVNPHMSEENARLQTFRDRIDHWPSHRIRATPQEIAHAGLYYLGKEQKVGYAQET